MTVTVFAVGTTGLPNFRDGPAHQGQPRIISMAAILYSPKWDERGAFHYIVKADGSVSSADAEAVHGVSDRERELYGVEIRLILASFMRFVRHSKEIACFNMPFHDFMMDVELARIPDADKTDWLRGGLKRTCILQEAGAKHNDGRVMKIPVAYEASTGLVYSKPEKGKHLYDVRAAARTLQELRRG